MLEKITNFPTQYNTISLSARVPIEQLKSIADNIYKTAEKERDFVVEVKTPKTNPQRNGAFRLANQIRKIWLEDGLDLAESVILQAFKDRIGLYEIAKTPLGEEKHYYSFSSKNKDMQLSIEQAIELISHIHNWSMDMTQDRLDENNKVIKGDIRYKSVCLISKEERELLLKND